MCAIRYTHVWVFGIEENYENISENTQHSRRNSYLVLMSVLIVLSLMALIGLMTGIRPRILTTDSMHPSIYKGSLVLLNVNSPWEELEEGDVIAFRTGATEVMHRVTAVTDEGLILKADNGEGESLVTKDMYVGKEVIAFPFIGVVLKPVLQHGKALVVLVAVVMIIAGCWSSRKSEE